MRRIVRFMIVLGVVMSFLTVAAPAALADPPPNDDIADATIIPGVPFAVGPIDTSEATGAIDDPQDCSYLFPTNGTSWYRFTPSADITIEANARGSDYDTTLGAFSGSPGALSALACNDDGYGLQSGVRIDAVANTTYYFMVGCFCDGQSGATGGGTLFFNVFGEPFQPPLEITMTVNRRGSVDPDTGVATITGTVACNVEASPVLQDSGAILQQRQGQAIVVGSNQFDIPCPPPGETAGWSAFLSGGFRPGPAVGSVFTRACDAFSCATGSDSQKVMLKPRRG